MSFATILFMSFGGTEPKPGRCARSEDTALSAMVATDEGHAGWAVGSPLPAEAIVNTGSEASAEPGKAREYRQAAAHSGASSGPGHTCYRPSDTPAEGVDSAEHPGARAG